MQSSPLAFRLWLNPKVLDPAPLRRLLNRPEQRLEEEVVCHHLFI